MSKLNMTKEEMTKRLGKLVSSFHELMKHKYFKTRNHFKLHQYIFAANFNELMTLLSEYEKESGIWSDNGRDKLTYFQKEFLRLFQNYLSSISSIFDSIRRLDKKLDNKGFSEFYEKAKKDLEGDESYGCRCFLKDLRNYSQHYGLIPVVAMSLFGGMGEKRLMCLKKDSLLIWKKWKADAKNYIHRVAVKHPSGDYIDINLVIKDYHESMMGFYEKLLCKLNSWYEKEDVESKNMKAEMEQLNAKLDAKH